MVQKNGWMMRNITMMKKDNVNTIGKSELVDLISAMHEDTLKKEAREWIDIVFDALEWELLRGYDVRIKNFGTFSRRKRKAMKMYNPHTGGRIDVDEKKSVAFVPAEELKRRLNG